MKNFVLNTTFSRDKTCRNDNCTLACLFQWINNVLNETGIYSHWLFLFGGYIWDSSPKTGWHGGYLFASVREVHLERRVTHHKIKLTQLLSVIALVVWAYKRVALNSIIKRRHKSVKQQIKFQHFVASLGNILRKDGTAFFAYLMTKCHQKRTCSCRGVITFHAMQISIIPH